ncbi:hypothetical protein GMOD_00000036 [Pyrenophora seminiperda CCB06]|uniref:Uncharacterized protein n=1 Tax=Pyrenophora seminiperda CCB06 TaxID=1302712 RepID=A0A3M7M6G8_9PLEO|nr:hypothetical protein GMOD_00000036 [Pyrenophora seminiperda CCB06]
MYLQYRMMCSFTLLYVYAYHAALASPSSLLSPILSFTFPMPRYSLKSTRIPLGCQ